MGLKPKTNDYNCICCHLRVTFEYTLMYKRYLRTDIHRSIQLNPLESLAIHRIPKQCRQHMKLGSGSRIKHYEKITHIFFLSPFFPLVSLLFFPTAMMDRGSSRRGLQMPRSEVKFCRKSADRVISVFKHGGRRSQCTAERLTERFSELKLILF